MPFKHTTIDNRFWLEKIWRFYEGGSQAIKIS